MSLINKVDNFIIEFLSDNKDLQELWKSDETQEKFKDLFNKKSKNTVKKNKTAYIFFCEAERNNIKKKYQNLDNKEILKKLGEQWSKIKNDEEKIKIFKDLALEDKVRYMSENKVEKKPRKSSKVVKEGPKKNSSAYIHFCSDMRSVCKEENPEITNKDILRVLGEKWKSLSEDGKKKYTDLAQKDKERYEEEKKSWVPSSTSEPVVEAPVVEEKPKTKKKAVSKKKEKEPEIVVEEEVPAVESPVPDTKKKSSAYTNYVKQIRPTIKAELPDLNPKDVMKEIGSRWKSLSDEEKAKYK